MPSGGRKRGRSGSCSPPIEDAPSLSKLSPGTPSATYPQFVHDSSLLASCGLLRNRYTQSEYGDITCIGVEGERLGNEAYVLRQNLVHLQVFQDLLRRTSLAEMRDREVVEYLLGTEKWLQELMRPLIALGAIGGGCAAPSSSGRSSARREVEALSNAYRSALSELRLLVLGVLHTMPWWRVVETVTGESTETPLSGAVPATANGGGRTRDGSGCAGVSTHRMRGSNSSMAAVHAITRWHVRLQIAFERVCLTLIDQSQQTVRGVLEVLLKPCQMRVPVRDSARRSIPSDSFIRVLNAVATKYSPNYVVELLDGCIADFMPKRRWAERRHHVACTAVLLYVALEGQTPAYHPRLGNSQSLQRAVELLKSLRPRNGEGRGSVGSSPSLLPRSMRSSSLAVPGCTSEESGTDVGGCVSPTSTQHDRRRFPLSSMLPKTGVLPSGYVSATMLEGAMAGEAALWQPKLLRPSPFGQSSSLVETTTTASDTELSDAYALDRRRAATAVSSNPTNGQGKHCTTVSLSGGGGGEGSDSSAAAATGMKGRCTGYATGPSVAEGTSAAAIAPGSTATPTPPSFLDTTVEHNNKLLSFRNDIVRVLLNRLLDVEVTLEFREGDDQHPQWSQVGGLSGFGNRASSPMMSSQAHRKSLCGTPWGSPGTTGLGSPALLVAQTSSFSASGEPTVYNTFPSDPITATDLGKSRLDTASSSGLSTPASLSPAALSFQRSGTPGFRNEAVPGNWNPAALSGASLASAPPLERLFNTLSQPYLRTLRDCATLVYGRLADDLRRQQIAGSCGNADWWMYMLFFHLTVVTRVDRPVYLLYLAPSLSMLGTEDESIGLLHKLITLVTKGSMPVEQPRSSSKNTSAGFGRSTTGAAGNSSSLLTGAPVQPVRLRMAPPTGASRRVVTMEERLRAARHIFPLFRFLREHIDEASGEGVRRRLLKWTAQELRRLHSGGVNFLVPAMGSSGGTDGGVYTPSRLPFSREARLALVTFAQCAAISELMDVDVVPQLCPTGKARGESTQLTSSTSYGDTFDNIASAVEPLLSRYTLQIDSRADDSTDDVATADAAENESSSSLMIPSTFAVKEQTPSRRRIDLRQMEFEGLLHPNLMAYCPWQAWLR